MDFAWGKWANFTMIFKKSVVMCTSQTVLCNNHCLFVFGKKSGSCELVFQVNGNLNRVSPGNKKKRVASSDLFTFLLHHQHFVYFFFCFSWGEAASKWRPYMSSRKRNDLLIPVQRNEGNDWRNWRRLVDLFSRFIRLFWAHFSPK